MNIYFLCGEPELVQACIHALSLEVEVRFGPDEVNVIVSERCTDSLVDWCEANSGLTCVLVG